MTPGDFVRILDGPFTGSTGTVVHVTARHVVVSLTAHAREVTVAVGAVRRESGERRTFPTRTFTGDSANAAESAQDGPQRRSTVDNDRFRIRSDYERSQGIVDVELAGWPV